MNGLTLLTTEESNPKSMTLDELSTPDILKIMNEEDQTIALAVEKVLPEVERTIEKVSAAFQKGGRLIYTGAGTSGRIGMLDAVECPPTFSTSPDMVQALLAGGNQAMFTAVEGAEDDELLGAADLEKLKVTSNDVVIGIAASGRTPYVKGAIVYANSCGAATVALTSNANSVIGRYADIKIEVVTGAEILTGSTRLRAATAHKMVLNMITTASMVKNGKVYKNLMVDLNASNYKLRERAKKMVCTVTDVAYEEAEKVLEGTGYNVKTAIVMIFTGETKQEAERLIELSGGFVRDAVRMADAKQG